MSDNVFKIKNLLVDEDLTINNSLSTNSANIIGDLIVDTNTLYVDSVNNRVGIGTTTPLNSLHVVGEDATNGSDFIALFQEPGITPEISSVVGTAADRAVMVQGNGGAFYLGRDVTNNIEFAMGTSSLGAAFAGSMTNHNLHLRTSNDTKVVIGANGNVGIGTGTTVPSDKLYVAGNIVTSGTLNTHTIPNGTGTLALESYVDNAISNIDLTATLNEAKRYALLLSM